jgi:hypothetical protein
MMNYGRILGRAWEITWRWKALWILGFLALLGKGGGGGSGGNLNYVMGDGDFPIRPYLIPGLVGVFLVLVCLALFVGIAFWVVSIIARGSLISGVQQAEVEGDTSFGRAWRGGTSRFWTLCGVWVLTSGPILLAVLGGLGALVLLAVSAGITAEFSNAAPVLAVLAPMLICGIPFLCLIAVAAVVLQQIRIYADRAAVLEELGWIDAFRRGWEVMRENIGHTIVLWFILFFVGLLVGSVIAGVLFAVSAPLLALGALVLGRTGPKAWMLLPVGCGGLVVVILGAAIGSVLETFNSATWTLAYREMAGMSGEPAVEPIADLDEER